MKTMTTAEWEATPADYRSETFGVRKVLVLNDETGGTELWPVTVLDERDAAILAERIRQLDAVDGPRCGDFVRFSDDRLERISHHWGDCVQTSEGGSFYLGSGYASFSGGLNQAIPLGELVDTGEKRPGSCWFFRHDFATAGGGIDVEVPFRVYAANGCREHVISHSGIYSGRPDWWGDYVAGATVAPERHIGGQAHAPTCADCGETFERTTSAPGVCCQACEESRKARGGEES